MYYIYHQDCLKEQNSEIKAKQRSQQAKPKSISLGHQYFSSLEGCVC